MRRFDLCDNSCTVDCGHCKGQGRPTLSDDVAAVLADALREEAWQGRWRPLDETNIVPLVNVTVPVILAALAAENYAVVKLPEGVAVAGARLVDKGYLGTFGRCYSIEAAP